MSKIVLVCILLCGVANAGSGDIVDQLKKLLCDQLLDNPKIDLSKVVDCIVPALKDTMDIEPLLNCFPGGKPELSKAAKTFCEAKELTNPFNPTEMTCIVTEGAILVPKITVAEINKALTCVPAV